MAKPVGPFQIWRRPKRSWALWEKVSGAVYDTQGRAFTEVGSLELQACDTVWEYAVLPLDQIPSSGPAPRR